MKTSSRITRNLFAVSLLLTQTLNTANAENAATVIQANEVNWGYLNPLRGDKSPGAANLWGDRTTGSATGMLVRFKKGFSSPPHIHNISYRGVVIHGLMHNDDPDAQKMWMPTGSYWTQPAGADHITSANGDTNLIYLEIDSGPYLVKPSAQQFDNGETPLNLHYDNLVWSALTAKHSKTGHQVKQALLWGSPQKGQIGGTLVKLPTGFSGKLSAKADEFRAVVIKGSLKYQSKDTQKAKNLLPGSYFSAQGQFTHQLTATTETLLYIRTNGEYDF